MIGLLWALACAPDWRELEVGPNPFTEADPRWSPQPRRARPLEVVAREGVAWVSLQGSVDEPGREIARIDLESGRLHRVRVGASPTGLALHPEEDTLVVTNRFANWLSVVEGGRESRRLPVDFYAIDAAFVGDTLWVTNRWRDEVVVLGWPGGEPLDRLPTARNPGAIAVSEDGSRVAVASMTSLAVDVFEVAGRAGMRLDLGAPANDVAFVGPWLVVATLSRSTHHPAHLGPDTDRDGRPGDGTPNTNFQDLQNELAVFDAVGVETWRYTSDTLCCADWRDVHPEDLARGGDLLPPVDRWIVGGALPERLTWDGARLWVSYSGSNEVQPFAVDLATGALTPGPVWASGGHNPHGLARDGDRLLVVHHLGDSLGALDVGSGALAALYPLGQRDDPPFPATDAEIGQLVNNVTAPFSVDGDQSCAHCHRERNNIDKAFSMPLTARFGEGLRMTMAYRGAADTRPWFAEAAMDENNFFPVINEFARVENFCCSDYTLFPSGAPADCEANPPPSCALEGPYSPDGNRAERRDTLGQPRAVGVPTRDAFYQEAAARLVGRTASFGDGLFDEDLFTGDRQPIPLDFMGITRSLGLFLLTEPALLPNPNPLDARARRGQALFESPLTGCSACHPAPTFTLSTDHNPAGLPLRFAPVVSPVRDESGENLDLLSEGFLSLFPMSEQEAGDLYLGVPSLRGLWDRAEGLFHHGRARGLREALATPGHPALRPGERGFNEVDGVPDTHGGTSHLTPDELDDLIAYLLTL